MTVRLIRAALPLLVSGVEAVLALRVLGLPDLTAAGAFLGGSVPTPGESAAFLELLLWVVLVAGSAVAMVAVVREGRRLETVTALREGWSLAVVLCGVAILLAGLVHQMAPPVVGLDGGGSVSQAARMLGP